MFLKKELLQNHIEGNNDNEKTIYHRRNPCHSAECRIEWMYSRKSCSQCPI